MSDSIMPYRVEWRPNLVTRWWLIKDCKTHEQALDEADVAREKWSGQTRVVSQHVVAVAGFGGGER